MVADFKQGTTLTGKILASGQTFSTTASTIYTVPTASAVKIGSFSLTNVSGSIVTVAVSVVPSGGTAGSNNQILSAFTLAANTAITHKVTLAALDGAFLDAGASISITTSTANAVNFLLTGVVSA